MCALKHTSSSGWCYWSHLMYNAYIIAGIAYWEKG